MAQLAAVLKNYPTYISKATKKLEKMKEGSNKNKVMHRLEEYQVQLDLAKKRLANVQLVQK
jgi:hypothetical protein